MELGEAVASPLNWSRDEAEPPRGEFNLSGLPVTEGKPLFGIGIENFITLIVFVLIFAMGVLGNSLVITVLARSKPGKRRSTTNIFILNLSIADLAYLLFCIPFQSTVYVLPTWVLGAFVCKFIHYFFTVSMLVSIFTLSAMSVDRYVAIVHSRRSSALRVSRNALLGVGLIWALSFAMASPVAHHQHLFHREASNQTFCWEQWPNPRYKKVYVVCMFVFGYLLPLLLISFCYAKTAQTVLVVVVVFGISWLPHHVIHLWAEFGVFPLTQASFLFRVTAHCLAYSNSSVNPIIYAFLSENFRKAYKQVFKCQIGNESPLNDAKENRSRIDTPPSTNCTHV
ncbi:galanin receptor type 1 isoform X2 [Pezoporus wallicus]|uniref:galanin receptor type 1 isoform X2 n=1 Tax=Pezoporus wallicus TaxID=35540 RepID=UPI00254E9BA9|nr:galanin receptor type 1 isoform X2 [Pezoporus wallicus]XP_061304921.1 galanin receptor type 1 isoform X2 [Pezoporus flaviventris]